MANGNSSFGEILLGGMTVFLAGLGAIFGLGKMKQAQENLEMALKSRVTQDAFEGLVAQVAALHDDIREIRTILEQRRAQ